MRGEQRARDNNKSVGEEDRERAFVVLCDTSDQIRGKLAWYASSCRERVVRFRQPVERERESARAHTHTHRERERAEEMVVSVVSNKRQNHNLLP